MSADYRELFDPELVPTLRRLGERPMGAGADAAVDPDDRVARQAVWQSLVGLGALAWADPDAGAHRPEPLPELVELAELMGESLLQSPYPDTVLTAELLATAEADSPAAREVRVAIAAGRCAVAVAPRTDGRTDPAVPDPVTVDDDRIHGVRRFVAFAADCDLLLVPAPGPAGTELRLVPRDQPGVRLRRHDDTGRGDLYRVDLDGAATLPGGCWHGSRYAEAIGRARLRHAAYLLGAARGAVELTTARLRSRSAFGQPLARNQALSFRLAALTARRHAVLALVRRAARADGPTPLGDPAYADPVLAGAQALMLAAELARETAAEAVHLHGAYGLTEASDAQLYFRRAVVDAGWWGTPAQLRRTAADALIRRATADAGGSGAVGG
ncbi:acyl-CoA dehydrogenase family protein [Micromonospora yangpuensis]|uniref:Acyl-CoA dehydrogenase n=1 Tax=Micromonospora yangpuensis TaxID=683228 RepID=A0A1C6VH77_9ACTN|nr:acyl-CoA dehydrogenase family protein [Micromonospora yangpuensis]GGL99311.1 acyl-CoA dehydrogenase [Micromonospora yangpuensis]SCL65557.1 Acyl-CoA dehydrogenase [Micromonospora yangpuensis]